MCAASLGLVAVLAAGCGGGGSGQTRGADSPATPSQGQAVSKSSGGRTGVPAPGWFTNPPKKGALLVFVGDATGASDEGAARDAAKAKALSELTTYCGAQIKSEGQSIEKEENGKHTYTVSVSLDVAGNEMTVREAKITETIVGKASDGTFDAYVLLEWPRAQYEAVLAAQKEAAARALSLYLEAEAKTKDIDLPPARASLKQAKAILGPMRSSVPLGHDKYKNTALLFEAMTALGEHIESLDKERRGVFAVAVECLRDGKPTGCNAARAGAYRTVLSKTGHKVATEAVSPQIARGILSSENPDPDRSVRSAGYVVAVRYTADLQGVDGPFTFIKAGARGVVYDTSSNRIVAEQEITPEKEGHPSYEGAMEKGFNNAEKQLLRWLEEQVPRIK